MNKRQNYLLERLYISSEIPLHIYSQKRELVIQLGIKEIEDPFHTDHKLWYELMQRNKEKVIPALDEEDGIFGYGSFFDTDGNYYVYGPIALEVPTIAKLHAYRQRHGLAWEGYSIKVKSYNTLANVLATAYWGATGQEVSEETILLSLTERRNDYVVELKDMDRYQFDNSEYQIQHLTHQYEQEYLMAIEEGNVDYFRESHNTQPNAVEKVGKLAGNSEKQMEYMCLSAIVLISRAAMRGGLNPSSAYSLSELYMQKLAKCNNTLEILKLYQAVRMDFVNRVREVKESKRNKSHVERCKDYIAQRVHYPIQIKEIAGMVGVNHSYLSRLFSQQEGMTIVQYSIKARLRAAANMLKYSDFSISEIADYFCFASQSKFGSQFKKEYGVTPLKYRQENQVIDFISRS